MKRYGNNDLWKTGLLFVPERTKAYSMTCVGLTGICCRYWFAFVTMKKGGIMDILHFFDRNRIICQAQKALAVKPRYITDFSAKMSEGGIHDYYSNGDYWWPNPNTANGLPYVRLDGKSNPNAFMHHRNILREMRTSVSHLAAGYKITKDEKYASRASIILNNFFLAKESKMNPSLLYAQAVPGLYSGRGIGIIDTLHLAEVPFAVNALKSSLHMTDELLMGLKKWFSDYLNWMTAHSYGISEMNEKNNHGICWHVQAASFALFVGNEQMVDFCRKQYKNVLLGQMAADGSFTKELARTKPYGYSIFTLDNLLILCHILFKKENDLWNYELNGKGARRGMEFLYPYLIDKTTWPYKKDIQHFECWPVAMASFLFAGLGLGEQKYVKLWQSLDPEPTNWEVRRNMTVRQPLLWLG